MQDLMVPPQHRMPSAAVVFLEFDGIYRSADLWINSHFLGHHSSGYTDFRFRFRLDTLPFLYKPGGGAGLQPTMLLAVCVDPRANEGWVYEGAGIYRLVDDWHSSCTHCTARRVCPCRPEWTGRSLGHIPVRHRFRYSQSGHGA
jgi:hypothetical protein